MSTPIVISEHRFVTSARAKARAFSQEVRDRLTERILDGSIIDESEPFIWEAIISNNDIDSYFTRMSEQTLNNFAEDGKRGVAFLDSHAWRQLGLGYTFDSEVSKGGEALKQFPNESRIQVAVSAYTIPGYNPGKGITSDDFIRGVRSGLIRDVSVGFYATVYPCSICGLNMFDWGSGCWHIPGFTYEKLDPDGKSLGEEVCFAWVADGRLSEVSAVYDGANEGAAISAIIPFAKAQLEAEAGRIQPHQRQIMESRYRHRLPVAATMFAPVTARTGEVMPTGEGADATIPNPPNPPVEDPAPAETTTTDTGELEETVDIPDEETPAEGTGGEQGNGSDDAPADAAGERAKAIVGQLRSMLSVKGLGVPAELRKAPVLDVIDWMVREVPRLRELAAEGETYRKDLVAETIKEGARAMGANFPASTYETTLKGLSISQIKEIRDGFRKQGDDIFNKGRQSQNKGDKGKKPADAPSNEAFS